MELCRLRPPSSTLYGSSRSLRRKHGYWRPGLSSQHSGLSQSLGPLDQAVEHFHSSPSPARSSVTIDTAASSPQDPMPAYIRYSSRPLIGRLGITVVHLRTSRSFFTKTLSALCKDGMVPLLCGVPNPTLLPCGVASPSHLHRHRLKRTGSTHRPQTASQIVGYTFDAWRSTSGASTSASKFSRSRDPQGQGRIGQ